MTNIQEFDSTVPDTAKQVMQVNTEIANAEEICMKPVEIFIDNGFISPNESLKTYHIMVQIENAETTQHSLCHYDYSIASANMACCTEEDFGFVGLIHVRRPLQGRGYGTQLKKMVNNHLRQYGSEYAFTYAASEGGKKLAKRTGFEPETDYFPNIEELWYREL